MSNPSDKVFRAVLGQNLQTGALRAILFLGAFAFIGACVAWLLH